MFRFRCFAIIGLLCSAITSVSAVELGYRTEGYTALANASTRNTNSGHRHFTKPAYSNSSYYRSYHAHKDAVLSRAYSDGAPWAWAYAPGYFGPGNLIGHYNYPVTALDTPLDSIPVTTPVRRLLKTQSGGCYEVQRNEQNEELRIELSVDDCNW